jgi:hypothetical protein
VKGDLELTEKESREQAKEYKSGTQELRKKLKGRQMKTSLTTKALLFLIPIPLSS